ncbi:MAG TPA: DUF3828 domain-containing protein [Paraburkholderia sp.]|jgi:hypothetical protein|nr:DUF3828 domain-containing protein [Paraburkholderia sp.]
MNRFVIAALFGLSLFVPSQSTFAAATADSPEALTTSFYSWFIAHDTDTSYPLDLPEIEKYVTTKTVSRLRDDYARSGPPGGVDYFLKVQDYDGRDWLAHRETGAAIELGNVAVVPVTFGSTNKTRVLVFLRQIDGAWKITKIDDTDDYR